jgi:hypothetical protein
MQNLIVSLSDNILKVSVATLESFKSVSAELGEKVVSGSEILDPRTFSEILANLVKDASSGAKDTKYGLHYLLEPKDVVLKFVTVRKSSSSQEENVLNEIKTKLPEINLDDLFFSYQKIAPFVYQFIGVEKKRLEKILEISDILGIEVKSVVPWVMLLPKYVGKNDPSIFISKNTKSQLVALSELGGIYFCEVFNKEKSSKEVEKYVSELSVYKRAEPINKIYILNGDTFSLDPSYNITPLIPAEEVPEEMKGYEIHCLAFKVLSEDPTLVNTQLNLLNLLPLPAVETKSKSLVYVGASVLVLTLLVGGFFVLKNKSSGSSQRANNSAVLSETEESTVASPPPAEVKPVLNKADIKIRIENAAGIPGLAAKTQTFLQGKGWVVSEIDTAEESGRTATLVRIKDSKKAFLDLLTADMKDSYQVTTETTLDETFGYDVLVLLGAK